MNKTTRLPNILFVCVHNAGRSQMAEVLFNRLAKGKAQALSAGTQPADAVDSTVVEAMREVGIDISGSKPKLLTMDMVGQADVVVTMGCGAEGTCLATFVETEEWGLEDPRGKPLPEVKNIRDEIRARVAELLRNVEHRNSSQTQEHRRRVMLLQDYKITRVGRSFCNPEWISVRAELSDDISEVLPYLNAVVKNAVYTPEAPNLNFKMDTGFISLMPREISVGQVACEEDAMKVLDHVKKLINDTWERRTGITPVYERKGEIKAKDILDFLPKTNCRDCGLPTCFAFAMALLKGQKRLEHCSALNKPEFTRDKEALARLLQSAISEEVAK